MPNLAELNVLVGADVKPLENGLNEAKSAVKSFATASIPSLDDVSNHIKTLRSQLDSYVSSIKTVAIGSQEFNKLTGYIQQTTKEIIALENAQKGVVINMTDTVQKAGGLGKAFNEAFSSVRQLAYILPGIGIAGIFSAIFDVISQAVSELDIFASKSKLVTEAINEQNQAFAQSAGNITKELSGLQALVGAARDENLTREQRNNAIKELQRIYPGVLDNLNTENISSQQATIAINKLTESIIRKSKAEAIAGLISKTQAAIFEQQNKPLDEQLTMLDKLKAAFLSTGGNAAGATGLISDALGNEAKNVKDLNTLLDGYQKQLQGVVTEEAKAGDFTITKPETAKALKTIGSILEDLRNKFSLIKSEEGVFGENLNPERISALKSAITELLNIKVSGTSATVQALINQMKTLQDEIDKAKQKIDLFAAKGGVTAPNAQQATGGTANPAVSPLLDLSDQSTAIFDKAEAKGMAAIAKLNAELQSSLTQTFENLAISLGESLGDLFSGKGNFLQNLGKMLGSAIKALGAQLIKLGFAAKVIQEAISKLLATPAGPFAVIAGGIALEAIGTAISNLGIQQHAEGGIFDKPTLIGSHLFGEKGPEALIPLNRMSSVLSKMGAGGNSVEVTGTIGLGYDKLLIAIERANRFTGRNYGSFNNG